MHVDTISMDPRIARIHYGDYMGKCKEHREKRLKAAEEKRLESSRVYRRARNNISDMEKEDRGLLGAYRALKKGEMVLNLNNVLMKGGLNKDKRPNLAAACADYKWCTVSNPWGDKVRMVAHNEDTPEWSLKSRQTIDYPFFDGVHAMTNTSWRERENLPALRARALVPTVPAHLRPNDLDKGGYYILWEAVWATAPPDDPLLLKRIDKSDFFVVLAQWDTTALEKQVLAGRFS